MATSRRRPGVPKEEGSAYGDDSSSDGGDYLYDKTGRTYKQAQKGEGRIIFPYNIKTMIFVYAITNKVCSKKAPTVQSFCGLVERVLRELNIAPGHQSSTQCIEAIADWIEHNVTERNLHGLLVEKQTHKAGRTSAYEISCSPVLIAAVEDRNFSFTDVTAMNYGPSDLVGRHADSGRGLIPWGESPADQPSMLDIKREAINWYHSHPRPVLSGNFGQNNLAGVQASRGPGHLPESHHGPGLSSSSNSDLPRELYSREAQPIHKADQQRSDNNKRCWKLWNKAVTSEMSHPQWVAQQLAEFNYDPEYDCAQDYVQWVIKDYKSTKAELDRMRGELIATQQELLHQRADQT